MNGLIGGLNPRPLSHESFALTTRPQLLAKVASCKVYKPPYSIGKYMPPQTLQRKIKYRTPKNSSLSFFCIENRKFRNLNSFDTHFFGLLIKQKIPKKIFKFQISHFPWYHIFVPIYERLKYLLKGSPGLQKQI
jgi:hypothetical protein